MIAINKLSKNYGKRALFENISLNINEGERIGLIGPNGAGKSTFFHLMLGESQPSSGSIQMKKDVRIGHLPQEAVFESNYTVLQELTEGDDLIKRLRREKQELEANHKADSGRYGEILHELEVLGAFELEHKAKKILMGLEFKERDFNRPISQMSGGWQMRVLLAKLLVYRYDILLLDEPTNFMDLPGKKWVMNFLSEYKGCVIVVSHDLELMNESIDKVFAINPTLQSIEEYKGTYSDFLRLKKQRDILLQKHFTAKHKQIKRMEKGLSKMTRLTSKKGVRQKVRQKKRIERAKLELPDLPKEVASIKVLLPEPARVGKIPVHIVGISKKYGNSQVLNNINFTIARDEKIALIGLNGTGKSTFIKILMDLEKADSGTIEKNPLLKIGYYSQEFEEFDFTETVIDTFCRKTLRDEGFARSFLGRFMFTKDKVFQRVGTLSGGEKTRLSIAIITATDNNLLVLDEPTTYLDVLSQRIILEALKGYKGTMILVSHSPEFIKELSPHKAFLFPEEKMVYWDDNLLERAVES